MAGRRSAATAILAAVLLAGAAHAAEKPATPNIWGVWIGLDGSDPGADKRWRNTPWSPAPQFTPWGAAESKRWGETASVGECDPFNIVWFMGAGSFFPIEFLQGPNQVVVIDENAALPRRIYTDGRGHPADLDPSWMGHSVGHWEGDTLVVDTVGLNGKTKPLNGFVEGGVTSRAGPEAPRLPSSDRLHLVERIRLVGDGNYLEDQITVDDPKAYMAPFTARRYWRRRPDIDVQEFYCQDNWRRDKEGLQAGETPPAPAGR